MRVMVTGSRNVPEGERDGIRSMLGSRIHPPYDALIVGDCIGVDEIARQWAHEQHIETHRFIADWERLGKAAGPERNRRMIDHGKPDLVLAFPGARSVGTWDAVRYAARRGVKIYLYPLTTPPQEPR